MTGPAFSAHKLASLARPPLSESKLSWPKSQWQAEQSRHSPPEMDRAAGHSSSAARSSSSGGCLCVADLLQLQLAAELFFALQQGRALRGQVHHLRPPAQGHGVTHSGHGGTGTVATGTVATGTEPPVAGPLTVCIQWVGGASGPVRSTISERAEHGPAPSPPAPSPPSPAAGASGPKKCASNQSASPCTGRPVQEGGERRRDEAEGRRRHVC